MLSESDKKLLQDFNRNVHWLKQNEMKKSKPKWVKARDIAELTGWDNNRIRRARENNVIIFKVIDGERMYDLNSLPHLFIKSINTSN